MLISVVALCAACGGGGDDDSSGGDDDSSGDDDGSGVDDDAADDDTGDDDADDDTADDDSSNDDTVDDDVTDDDSSDDDTADDDTSDDDSSIIDLDFEDYPLGPLGAPFVINATGGTAEIVNVPTKGGYGHCVEIDGDTPVGLYLVASYTFAVPVASDLSVDFDLLATPGSTPAFAVDLITTEEPLSVLRVPGGDLYAWQDDIHGYVYCGVAIADNTWVTITIAANYGTATYDVHFNHGDTDCANFSYWLPNTSFAGFSLADVDGDGFGGTFYFDNIRGY